MRYLDDYRKLHEQGVFSGMTLAHFAQPVARTLEYISAESVLDYGAGTGKSWEADELAEVKRRVQLALYDPGVPAHDKLPDEKFDAVISFDVLEHVPEEEVDETLDKIFARAKKMVILSFCARGSKKKLPSTGQDVHVTQRPREWWEQRISRANLAKGQPTVWLLFENP